MMLRRRDPSQSSTRQAASGAPAEETVRLVVFSLDGLRLAVPLASVSRVVRAVAVTPLPHGPDAILGAVDVAGTLVPVHDLRRRFGLPARPVAPEAQMILGHTTARPMALVVERVEGVVERPARELVPPDQVAPGMRYVAGVVRLGEGIVFIHDLDAFLAPDEESTLASALQAAGAVGPS